MYTDFQTFRKDIEMLISETDGDDDGETYHTFDYVEGFVVLNNEDPKYNGWKIVPFSPDDINSSMIPEDAGPVMYCIEVTKSYNSSDDLPSLEEVGSRHQHPLDLMFIQLNFFPKYCASELMKSLAASRLNGWTVQYQQKDMVMRIPIPWSDV